MTDNKASILTASEMRERSDFRRLSAFHYLFIRTGAFRTGFKIKLRIDTGKFFYHFRAADISVFCDHSTIDVSDLIEPSASFRMQMVQIR